MQTKPKSNNLLSALCALSVLSLSVMIFFLLQSKKNAPAESFTPPPFDQSALSGFPEVPENLGFSPLDIEQGFTAYLCGNLTAKDGTVPVYFTSPDSNTVLIRLQLLDEQKNLLAETGLLKPGEYIENLTLSEHPDNAIPVTLKIIAYRPETYHSMGTAGLNTVLTPEQ